MQLKRNLFIKSLFPRKGLSFPLLSHHSYFRSVLCAPSVTGHILQKLATILHAAPTGPLRRLTFTKHADITKVLQTCSDVSLRPLATLLDSLFLGKKY